MMHGICHFKIINAQKAKVLNNYTNTYVQATKKEGIDLVQQEM
jgi:hypothetical protein